MTKRNKNYLNRNLKKERTNDRLTIEKRSVLMSKIKSRDTKFEKEFVKLLKQSLRHKFETNVLDIKGKPDIVFRKKKLCIFLDSDFWHGWYYPRWKHLLKDDFWRNKIENNRKRDIKTTRYLRRKDYIVLRYWEHQIKKTPNKVILRIKEKLNLY